MSIKNKLVYKNLYEPVFRATVWFLYGGDISQLTEWYKKKKIESDCDPFLDGYVELLDKKEKNGAQIRTYIIRVENKDDFYCLSHELIHLVKHILKDRGVPFSPENDEVIAYYHGYWLKRLWRMMGK